MISGLEAKGAELAGKVQALEAELDEAKPEVCYVFCFGNDPAEIKVKRYRNASRLFKRNKLQRTVFSRSAWSQGHRPRR